MNCLDNEIPVLIDYNANNPLKKDFLNFNR